MKILQIAYSLSSGGGERFVVDLCNRLAENTKNKVTLLITNDERIPKNAHYLGELSTNVRFISLRCHSGLCFQAFRKVYKTIKEEKPDIVHANCNLLLLCLPSLFLRKAKYFQTLHNVAQACVQKQWLKGIYHWFYNHRIQPVIISKTCQQSYIDFYGDNQAICITNGRESLVPSGNIPKDVIFLKEEHDPIFIHIARCAAQKNQNRLFKAFERLQEEGIKYHLIVLGSGYENKWIPYFKNNPQIHVLGEKKNIADYMALADFFVLSSDYEGLPLTLLEAMSLGVAPVCTPAGGIVDVIEEGKNGYLVSSFNDEDFYQKIKYALNDKGKLTKDSIRRAYEANYSMKVCTQKYYEAYQNHSLLDR